MRSDHSIDFTVIIPYFNDVDTIKSCLESALNQVYPPRGIIVIDDHSVDYKFIQDLCRKYDIRLVRNESNMGSGYSRNLGINSSSTKFIAFLDADDMWDRHHLEIHSKLWKIASANVALVGTKMRISKNQNSYFFDHNSNSHDVDLELRYPRTSELAVKNPFFNSATSIFLPHATGSLYYGLQNPTFCEDYGLIFNFLKQGFDVALSNEVTGTYLVRADSKSTKHQLVFLSRLDIALGLISLKNVDSKLIRLNRSLVAYLVFLSSIKAQLNSGHDFHEISHVYFHRKFTFRMLLSAFRNRIIWSLLLTLNRFLAGSFMVRIMHRRSQFRNPS